MNLEARAKDTRTTSLIVWQNGEQTFSYGDNTAPCPLYSMTKSFVSLAIGFLFDEKKIVSLDTPVAHWFEEWKSSKKSLVTIRMLLTHTSGIADHFIEPDGSFNVGKFEAFKKVSSVINAAMALPLVKEPGTHASYSNSSVDILVALVQKISKMRIDHYVQEKLFGPLGITDWKWVSSTKQLFGIGEDEPSGADGLVMSAKNLLKVGKMILQEGIYEGKQIVSADWIRLMSSEVPNPCLKMELGQTEGVPIEKYCAALLWMVPESVAAKKNSEVFMGWGFLGQYFMIFPAKKKVAIRLHDEGLPNFSDMQEINRLSFADFEHWIRHF